MEVHLWGGQGAGGGYGGSCCGGTGAYVYGVLPKSALGSALRIVVGYATAADAGEAAWGTWPQSPGGGRSAVQIKDAANTTGTGWLDIVTAGGGAGQGNGGVNPASSTAGSTSALSGSGACAVGAPPYTCSRGRWLQGQSAYIGAFTAGGGGGWCGGLSSFNSAGGGSSRIDALACYAGVDGNNNNAPFTADPYYVKGVNEGSNAVGYWPQSTGLVVLVPLPAAVATPYLASCRSAAPPCSPSPTPAAQSSAAPPSATPTPAPLSPPPVACLSCRNFTYLSTYGARPYYNVSLLAAPWSSATRACRAAPAAERAEWSPSAAADSACR